MAKKVQMSDIAISHISLCKGTSPKNKKDVVRKSKDGEDINTQNISFSKIKKSDSGTKLFVTVLEPDSLDSDNEFATVSDVEKAQYEFIKKGNQFNIDTDHDLNVVKGVFVAENYILKSEDKNNFPDTKIGSWVSVLKADDSTVFDGVTGVSMYGKAVKTEVEKGSSTTTNSDMKSFITNLFKEAYVSISGYVSKSEVEKAEIKKAIEIGISGFQIELEKSQNRILSLEKENLELKDVVTKSQQDDSVQKKLNKSDDNWEKELF